MSSALDHSDAEPCRHLNTLVETGVELPITNYRTPGTKQIQRTAAFVSVCAVGRLSASSTSRVTGPVASVLLAGG